MKLDIKSYVGGGKKVEFVKYANKVFYFQTMVSEGNFIFTVSAEELGTATVNPQEDAILFMKWIKKYIVIANTEVEENTNGEINS